MRREAPLILSSVIGIVVILEAFVQVPLLTTIAKELMDWVVILSAAALCLASVHLMRTHIMKVSRRSSLWLYSVPLLVVFIVMSGAGLFGGTKAPVFTWLFDRVYAPVDASLYGMYAFFLLSACFRAFRAKNLLATALLVTGIVVMLGRSALGPMLHHQFPTAVEWIFDIPNTAANRGVLIGATLGLMSASFRLLVGIDRSYMAGE